MLVLVFTFVIGLLWFSNVIVRWLVKLFITMGPNEFGGKFQVIHYILKYDSFLDYNFITFSLMGIRHRRMQTFCMRAGSYLSKVLLNATSIFSMYVHCSAAARVARLGQITNCRRFY